MTNMRYALLLPDSSHFHFLGGVLLSQLLVDSSSTKHFLLKTLDNDSPAAKNSKEAGSDYLSPFSPLANWRSDFFREEIANSQ